MIPFRKFPKKSISRQILFYYTFLILIPILISWYATFCSIRRQAISDLELSEQTQLETAYNSLLPTHILVCDILSYLQNNLYLTNYLSGHYRKNADMVYNFKKEIRPFIRNFLQYNTSIEDISIFCPNQDILILKPELQHIEDLSLDENMYARLFHLKYGEYLWSITSENTDVLPSVRCYGKVYSPVSFHCIGYSCLYVSAHVIENFFSLLSSTKNQTLLVYQGDTLIYKDNQLQLPSEVLSPVLTALSESNTCSYSDSRYLVNSLYIDSMDCRIIRIQDMPGLLSIDSNPFKTFIICLLCLGILSLFFFLYINRFTGRIVRFSHHMESSPKGSLLPYPSDNVCDEFTTLIHNYNTMITCNTRLSDQVHQMELLTKDAQYTALQAQMHPHFIYGTLESIRMLALQNDDNEVEQMLLAFSKFMRYTLTNTNQTVTLKDELENTKAYLQIQQLRFAQRLTYNIHAAEDLLSVTCPAFILQPLVENAVVHGIAKVLTPCRLDINIYRTDGCLKISVANNGEPPDPFRLKKVQQLLAGTKPLSSFQTSTGGFAMYNINERLKLFFPDASLQFDSKDGYTTNIITIPRKDLINHENTHC